MDERRIVSRFIAQRGTGRVVVAGHSMGGVIALLQAAVEPSSVAGLVLTSSALPWTKGGFPHPAVMGAFALYDTPGLGDRFARLRMRRMDPEQVVRFGYRMVMADPSTLPEEIVRLNVDLVRERQGDPDAPDAFLDAARSMLRLGRRPQVSTRALDSVGCPVLVLHGRRDRFVPASVRGSRARGPPDVARPHLPRPGSRAPVGGARALVGRGRGLVRRDRPLGRTGVGEVAEGSLDASRQHLDIGERVPIGGQTERHRSPQAGARDGERAALAQRHRRIARHAVVRRPCTWGPAAQGCWTRPD